jgi:hypothetical protein
MSVIADIATQEIVKYKNDYDDDAEVWGASDDTGKNNSKYSLRQLYKFIEERQRVNIMLITMPPRYDLIPSSCVNNEVIRFNRKLKKENEIVQ